MPTPVIDPPSPLTLPATFPEILLALYTQRFTGAVTLHLSDGLPRLVEVPGPTVKYPIVATPRA